MRSWCKLDYVITTAMSGLKHKVISLTFFAKILSTIAKILGHNNYLIYYLRLTKFHFFRKQIKKGKERIYNKIINLMAQCYHKLRYSKPLAHFHLVTECWLVKSKTHTSIVIIVLIMDNCNSINVETGQFYLNNRSQTRNLPDNKLNITKQIYFDIAIAIILTNHFSTIPYFSLFDTPNLSSNNIIISVSQLSKFAKHIYIVGLE